MTIRATDNVQQAKAPQGAPMDTPPEASAAPDASPLDSYFALVTDSRQPLWKPVIATFVLPFAYASEAFFGCSRTGFEIGEGRPIDTGNSGGAGTQTDAGPAGAGGTGGSAGVASDGGVESYLVCGRTLTPTAGDRDGDTIPDAVEANNGTNPDDPDTDNDCFLDDVDCLPLEFSLRADGTCGPPDIVDVDPDLDGLTTMTELATGTDPYNADTDGDGFCDGPVVVDNVCDEALDCDPLDASKTTAETCLPPTPSVDGGIPGADAAADAQTRPDGGSTVSDAGTVDGAVVSDAGQPDAGPQCTLTSPVPVTDPAVLGGATIPDIILAGSTVIDGGSKSRIGLSFTRNRDGAPNIDFKLITSDFVTPSLQEIELTPAEKISNTNIESSRSSLAWTRAPNNQFFVSYANRDTSISPTAGTMEGAWIGSNGLKISDAPVGSDPASFVYSSAALATDAGVLVYWMDSMTPPVTRLHRTHFDTSGTRVSFNDPFTPNNASSLAAADSLSTGGAVLAWQDQRDGNLEVYATVVDDSGNRIAATTNDIRLTNNTAISTSPAVAANGAEAGIAYVDNRVSGGTQLFFSIVADDGNVRVKDIQISESPAVAREPDIAWNGSEYLVVWQDQRAFNGVGNHEIYAQRLDQDGNKIDAPIRITDHPATSDLPKVIAVADDFIIVFEDRQDSGGAYRQIYLSKWTCR